MDIIERDLSSSFVYAKISDCEERKYYVIDNVPDDIIMLFFSYLSLRDFVVVGHVNKRWYDLRNVVLVVGGIKIQRVESNVYRPEKIAEEVLCKGFFERHREVRKEVLNAFRIEYFAMQRIVLNVREDLQRYHMDNLIDNLEIFLNMNKNIFPNEDMEIGRRICITELRRIAKLKVEFINSLAHQILLLISKIEQVRRLTDLEKQITTENYYQDPFQMREVLEDVYKYDNTIGKINSDHVELKKQMKRFSLVYFIAITIISVCFFIEVLLFAIFVNFVILPKTSLRFIPSISSAVFGYFIPYILILVFIIRAFLSLKARASREIIKAARYKNINIEDKEKVLFRDSILGCFGILFLSYFGFLIATTFACYGSFKLSHMVSNKFLQGLLFISPIIINSLMFMFFQNLLLFIAKSIIYKKFYFFDNLILKNRIPSFGNPLYS